MCHNNQVSQADYCYIRSNPVTVEYLIADIVYLAYAKQIW